MEMVTATAMEENGEFCLAVGPATKTVGILIQLLKGAGYKVSRPSSRSESYSTLIEFDRRWLKASKADAVLTLSVCAFFLLTTSIISATHNTIACSQLVNPRIYRSYDVRMPRLITIVYKRYLA